MNEVTPKLIDFLTQARKLIDDLLAELRPSIKTVEELKAKIPEDLQQLLSLEENGQAFVLRPRQYLGTENFSKILSVVRGLGGQYISAGKDSRFEIPRGK